MNKSKTSRREEVETRGARLTDFDYTTRWEQNTLFFDIMFSVRLLCQSDVLMF